MIDRIEDNLNNSLRHEYHSNLNEEFVFESDDELVAPRKKP